jgi:membrane protease YdiL (CAAX protease family)
MTDPANPPPRGFDTEIWVFLGMIVLANTLFIYAIAHGYLPERLYAKGRFLLLGGTLVSVVVAFRGLPAAWALLRPMANWRVNPLWYLLALTWAPAVCTLTLLFHSRWTGTPIPPLNTLLLDQPRLILTVLLAAFVGEIVWVSFAIGRLSARYPVFQSSLIVGIFWSLWWVPIVLLGVGVIPGLPLAALAISMLGVAVMCGFVYHWTKSGVVVLVLQITVNSSLLIFPVVPTADSAAIYNLFSVIYLCASVALHLTFGPRPMLGSTSKASLTQTARL